MLLYYLDLAGVAVFAASGVMAARDRDLDLFGIAVVAMLTAIGGGTHRWGTVARATQFAGATGRLSAGGAAGIMARPFPDGPRAAACRFLGG
ncbi:MAG: TRIC cation channel family protein [Thermodesulfobacteriota bacterium]